jgi:hypothetical protein
MLDAAVDVAVKEVAEATVASPPVYESALHVMKLLASAFLKHAIAAELVTFVRARSAALPVCRVAIVEL